MLEEIKKTKLPPIPPCSKLPEWRAVPIEDCGERIIPLTCLGENQRIVVHPQYYMQKIEGATSDCLARETVGRLLVQVARSLPHGYRPVVWDAWRPLDVQRVLFEKHKLELRSQRSDLSDEELSALAQTYVSLPTVDDSCPPPHSTGGAVDLTIMDSSGNYLEMGTNFDDFAVMSHTRYFENKLTSEGMLSPREQLYLLNRRVLYHAMINAGFTNYSEEWWHFDYGDQFWGATSGQTAIYGRVSIQNMGSSHKCAPGRRGSENRV